MSLVQLYLARVRHAPIMSTTGGCDPPSFGRLPDIFYSSSTSKNGPTEKIPVEPKSENRTRLY